MTEDETTNAAQPIGPEEEPVQDATVRKAEKSERVSRKLQGAYALPQATPKILSDILKAYVIASNQGADAISYKDVAVVANLHPTNVSRNNSFLAESGFIVSERYGYYRPAIEVTEFAKEAPWDEDGAKRHIRLLIDKTWYGEIIRQKFQMRGLLAKEELIKAFGIKATPDPSDANRLDLLLDFLEYTDYLQKDEGGGYVRSQQEATERAKTEHLELVDPFKALPIVTVPTPPFPASDPGAETGDRGVTLQVSLNVNLGPSTPENELREIARRVRSLLEMLKEEQ